MNLDTAEVMTVCPNETFRGGGVTRYQPNARALPIYLRRSAPHVAPQDKLGRFVREFLGDLSADDDGSRRKAARGAVKTRKENKLYASARCMSAE